MECTSLIIPIFTFRATSIAVPSPEDPTKMVAKKVYYLACAFCRWTSRDIGLPDQNVASGGWPDQENLSSERISALLEHYRSIAQREKIEKESRRFLGRKLSYLQLSDKYGLTTVVARKRAGLPPLSSMSGGREDVGRQVDVAPAEPVDLDEENDFPEDLMTEPLDLFNITSMSQRLAQLEFQPEKITELFPKHKHLMIKRSQRCRRCEHNLSKPEYNPTSIKFKIQLAAYYHVPDIIIYTCGELAPNKPVQLVIKVTNPSNTGTVLEFLDLDKLEELKAQEKDEEKDEKPVVSAINPLRQPSIVKSVDQSLGLVTATAKIPSSKVYLPPKDEAAEFDDHGVDLAGHVDDRDLVVWRKNNKVGLKLLVTPSSAGEQIIGLGIQYQYTNTVFALGIRKCVVFLYSDAIIN